MAALTEIPEPSKTATELVTFGDLREQLEVRLNELGFDTSVKSSWDAAVGEEGLNDLVFSFITIDDPITFLRLLDSLAVVKMVDVGDTLPGIIDLTSATKPEIVASLIEMERLYKRLSEYMAVLESNRGQLRMKLGEIMRDNSESEFTACNPRNQKLANIKLELKMRPSWPVKDDQFSFFQEIGQGDLIQPTVAWQTGEKVLNAFIDDAEDICRYNELPGVETYKEDRSKLLDYLHYDDDHNVFLLVQDTDRGGILYRYTGLDEYPFQTVCKLYQTVVAKVTKLY